MYIIIINYLLLLVTPICVQVLLPLEGVAGSNGQSNGFTVLDAIGRRWLWSTTIGVSQPPTQPRAGWSVTPQTLPWDRLSVSLPTLPRAEFEH